MNYPMIPSLDVSATDTVLIIDDSPVNIKLLRGLLQDDCRIQFAMDGETGIRLARERAPHVILLDVEMPGMDGFEVCRRLKADPTTSDSAIIFVTAHTGSAMEIAALEAGAVDFVSRPFVAQVIRARVRTHLTLRRQADLLQKLVRVDDLTGVFNRRYFNEQIAIEWDRHKRQKMSLGLAIIDIDHFKRVNDSLGHQGGDQCLRTLGLALKSATQRAGEVVTRYGGEEFAVIIPAADEAALQRYGDYICNRVRALALPNPGRPEGIVTISVGLCSQIPTAEHTVSEFISAADAALYQAKYDGRNRFVVGSL